MQFLYPEDFAMFSVIFEGYHCLGAVLTTSCPVKIIAVIYLAAVVLESEKP